MELIRVSIAIDEKNWVKRYGFLLQDLSKLNRDPTKIIYLSAHARENSLQPENGAVIKPFKLELEDTALLDFIPFLECEYMSLPLNK